MQAAVENKNPHKLLSCIAYSFITVPYTQTLSTVYYFNALGPNVRVSSPKGPQDKLEGSKDH